LIVFLLSRSLLTTVIRGDTAKAHIVMTLPSRCRSHLIYLLLMLMIGARCKTVGFAIRKTFSRGVFQSCSSRTMKQGATFFPPRKTVRPFVTSTTLNSINEGSPSSLTEPARTTKLLQSILHDSLRNIHLDPEDLLRANEENMRDPSSGYDTAFGRPAIRTYRSFIFSNKSVNADAESSSTEQNDRLKAAADRCAQQIEFLRRRHRAQSEDWVRNHDNPGRIGLEDACAHNLSTTDIKRFPIILILDNLRSAFNVGSIFRTADACGCQKVLTTGITAHPGGSGAEKLSKSALGSERLVPHEHFKSTADALTHVQQKYPGWTLIGMETTENSIEYTHMDYSPSDGICVILGNEVTGIDPDVLQNLDSIVEIPMFGTKNSLNVAACAPGKSTLCFRPKRGVPFYICLKHNANACHRLYFECSGLVRSYPTVGTDQATVKSGSEKKF